MEYLAYIFMQIIVSDETNVSNMEGTLSTFIAIIDMLLLFLCVVLIQRMFKGQKNRILYDEEQLEMYNALNDNFEKQRAENHEFQNHIMCIRSLVENGEYDSLKEYINEISRPEQAVVNVIDTNNAIVNAVINTKYHEANSKHIVFVFKINDLSGLKISDKDIVVLLSNLLNNAIEACEKCEGNRVIKLKFMVEGGMTILSVRNTFSHPLVRQGDDFLTTKDYE